MEIEYLVDKIMMKLLQKPTKINEKSVIILKNVDQGLQNQVETMEGRDTGLLLGILELCIKNRNNTDYTNMDSMMQILNMLLREKQSIKIVRTIKDKVVQSVLIIRTAFEKNIIVMKYLMGVVGQILQMIEIENYSKYEELIETTLINNIYNDNAIIRKQAGKSLKQLLINKININLSLSTQIKQSIIKLLLENERTTQFSVQFIQKCIESMQISVKNDILYSLVKAIPISNDNTKCIIFLCFEDQLKSTIINSNLAETVLKELIENQIYFDNSNIKLIISYAQCLLQSITKLHQLNNPIANHYFSSILSILSELFFIQTDQIDILDFAQKTIEMLFIQAFNLNIINVNLDSSSLNMIMDLDIDVDLDNINNSNNNKNRQPSNMQKIIAVLEYLLGNRFLEMQKYIFNILSTFFNVVNEKFFESLESIIERITSIGMQEMQEYQILYGNIIKRMGVDKMLKKYPLKIKQQDLNLVLIDCQQFEQRTNLWIVPFISRHIKKAKLIDFMNHIYVVLEQLDKMKIEDEYILKFVNYIIEQIWMIFSNCYEINSTDQFNMKQVKCLLERIEQEWKKEERQYVLKGLDCMVFNSKMNKELEEMMKFIGDKMIGRLAQLYQEGRKKAVDVIESIAEYCSQELLGRLFKQNINKFISGKSISNPLDLDILLGIFTHLKVDNDQSELVLQFMQTFISNHSLQKKTYHLGLLLAKKLHSSQYQSILNIIHSHITFKNSQYNKLLLFNHIFNSLLQSHHNHTNIFTLIQQYLPDILLALRDNNHKNRRLSSLFLLSIVNHLDNAQLQDYIYIILAGLASQHSGLKCDTIRALQLIFTEYHSKIPWDFQKRIFKLVLMMIKEKNKEIYMQVIIYIKSILKRISLDQLKEILGQVLDALLVQDDQHRLQFRTQVKNLIGKILKKVGDTFLLKNSPQDQLKIINYVIKTKKKEKSKKNKPKKLIDRNMEVLKKAFEQKVEKDKKKTESKNNKRNKVKNIDREVMEEEEFEDVQPNNTKNYNKYNNKNNKNNKQNNNLLLKYDANQQNFHFEEHPIQLQKQLLQENNKKLEKDDGVQYVKGKIVVKEEQEQGGKKRKREGDDRFATIENYVNHNEKKVEQNQQRKLVNLKIKQKQNNIHNFIESGKTYKSYKSQGDVLIAGKPDPYAFIQLNPKVLTKKFKDKSQNAFDQIVSQKNSGSLKGLKQKKFKQ